MDVGFIGLGTMGAHIARNLLEAGHKLTVHDARKAAADGLVAVGANWAATPKDLAAASELMFASLPGPPEVEAVTLGAGGILEGIRAGAALFDLTTNSPTTVRKIHAAFAEKGAHMLDAPVSGGPAGAESGRLAIWVSGEQEVFDRFKPVLDQIGDQPRYIGAIGTGSVAKLVHNCAGYIVNAGLAEVFSLGVKAGVDPLDLWEAVRHGALGRMTIFDVVTRHFLPAKFDPAQFRLALAHKDVSLATGLGRELGVPMRLANLTLEEMTEAMNRGWGDRDSRVAMSLETERAGVEIAVDPDRLKAALEAKDK